MSVETRPGFPAGALDAATSFRGWALASAAVLSLAYLWVLGHVVDVVGGNVGLSVFVLEVLGTLALSAALARVLPVRYAVATGVALLALGLLGYLATVPAAFIDIERQVSDTIALLTGLSVLRMTKAGVWALGFTPAPLFVSWYFFVRREYPLGALVGGAALSFFVLTGDADTIVGLVGAVGAVGAVGFGRMDREGGSVPQRNTLIAVIVAMLVVTTTVSLVPGGEARPLLPGGGTTTVEGSLIEAGSRVPILGSITLSPEARFTVTAGERAYWRVGAYDRYTGSGWVRTGEATGYSGPLARPPGDAERIRQAFRAESPVATMPAAWKPVRVGLRAEETAVTSMGGLQPVGSLQSKERYTVVSYRPRSDPGDLRAAGRAYPAEVRERYLQLPESTPERVRRFTAELTAEAENPYETAVVIERWLERNKRYSLDVERPEGDIAAAFLFRMEAGYCTYFATTMVAMLRSQGIPARFVVGYTPGQQVADDRYVVRGFDSHAWVEVYFPGEGWIRFDPTPAGPRLEQERSRLRDARAAGQEGVDTELSEGNPYTPTGAVTETPGAGQVSPANESDPGLGVEEVTVTPNVGRLFNPANPGGATGDGGGLPSREVLLYVAILLAGVAVAIERTGVHARAYRELWLRASPRGSPRERVEGAFDRLEYLLSKRYRERRDDETPREYIDALSSLDLDERALRLYRLYERARYSGDVTEEDAETAGRLLRELR